MRIRELLLTNMGESSAWQLRQECRIILILHKIDKFLVDASDDSGDELSIDDAQHLFASSSMILAKRGRP
jgi:hypothetical protein